MSSALATSGSTSYGSAGNAEDHPQEVLHVGPASCPGRGTAGRSTSCRRRRRSSAAWPAGGWWRSRPARRRTGRGCPGRRWTARSTADESTAIGCASRGSRRRSALMSSCSSVWRRILSLKSSSSVCGGQLAVDQQVGDFEERRVLRELLDRVAAVAQDARVAVDIGDGGAAGRGVDVAGVERGVAGSGEQLSDVERRGSLGGGLDRQLLVAAGQVEHGGVVCSHRGGSLTLGWAGFRLHASAPRRVCAR